MNSATRGGASTDFALAAIVVLVTLGYHAATGFQTLVANGGDNDSLLRMVEVRDLIAGQGWFDLHQYRMGPDGGFVMHWSRFVDAPIAALVLAGAALTGSMAAGETVALVAWPMLLMLLAMATLFRIVRGRMEGGWPALPMATIGGTGLYFIGVFKPGDIDHHNVQLVLTLVTVAALATSQGFASGLVAGVASALMLAIGMETLPYVAVAGLVAAAGFLIGAQDGADKARGFGLGFAGFGLFAFVATVPADAWFAAQCDAYSIPQFSIALVAGAGLAAAAGLGALRRSFAARLATLAALGSAVAVVVAVFFPQCLAGPYSGLDPRLQKFWLDSISEAQPLWKILATDPGVAAAFYVTPLIALAVLAWQMRRAPTQAGIVILAFLAAAVLVSFWQVRGSTFSVTLATIPLALLVGAQRRRIAAGADRLAGVRLILTWLFCLNIVWAGIGAFAAAAVEAPGMAAAEAGGRTCDTAGDYAALAAMPATTVLAISNLGAPILFHTHHRVLAGPYHRNIEGDLAALDALMGSEADARAVMSRYHAGLVAVCRGNSETASLVEWAPAGLLASLVQGRAPAWLERLPGDADEALELYRIAPAD